MKVNFFIPFQMTGLNEELVQLLLIRDELHTEQDAMLVDIEDLTRSVMLPCHAKCIVNAWLKTCYVVDDFLYCCGKIAP